MEEPFFYQGQSVICVKATNDNDQYDVVEGRGYVINNPDCMPKDGNKEGEIWVSLIGYPEPKVIFGQKLFIPQSFDQQVEEEINEALKGIKILT